MPLPKQHSMNRYMPINKKSSSLSGKISSVTLLFILFCLNGCSQADNHNFHNPHKLPIDAKRWYQLNNISHGLEQLFDGKQYDKPTTGYGLLLDNYDAYYPLAEGEQISIDSIMMFDWEGSNEDRPTTIYAITLDWEKIPIAVFTGERYGAWNGPDPKNPDVFALGRPVTNIRYLVINSWGNFPGELEFYGTYTPPTPLQPKEKAHAALKDMFGINVFEWDFEEPNDPSNLDPERLAAIKNFTGIRHYLDWDKIEINEGTFAFSPAASGGWNYDTIYQWCKDNDIEVLACLKTIPPWMQETYPEGQRDNENIPMRYGKKNGDPLSYIEQARAGFQFAARYGKNKNIDSRLIRLDHDNQLRIGLGTINYIECDNERDKWWKGRKAYQTGREYAANLSAFYDGHKNSMGAGVGVKNADPLMKVVMAGLAAPNPDYVRGMIDWCKEFRGYKTDGKPDLPWDIINYHYYCNDADHNPDKAQKTGTAPELTHAEAVAGEFIKIGQQYDMPVWITETGYDIASESPQAADGIGDRTPEETQADWLLRTSLMYSRAGIQKVFYYELVDDNPKLNTQYATSGLINADRSNRPAADYFRQTNKLFGKYRYAATVYKNPVVDKYENGGQPMYLLVVPDKKGRKAKYLLNLGNADTAFIYRPLAGSSEMELKKIKTQNGKVEVLITETPVFITPNDLHSNKK